MPTLGLLGFHLTVIHIHMVGTITIGDDGT
jgi:hypothetical protein